MLQGPFGQPGGLHSLGPAATENPAGREILFSTFLPPHSGQAAFAPGRGTRASNSPEQLEHTNS